VDPQRSARAKLGDPISKTKYKQKDWRHGSRGRVLTCLLKVQSLVPKRLEKIFSNHIFEDW
jgi:hypothetical protein